MHQELSEAPPPVVPRGRDLVAWSALVAIWLLLLSDAALASLPPRFIVWSVLAGPAYLIASRERAAMAVVVIWAALIGFCIRWSGHPPDVGFDSDAELVPFKIACAILTPAPFVIAIVALQRSVRGRAVAPRSNDR